MATIQEVASVAGVSRATISRVVNGHASVTPETVRRVKRSMAQLGYVPKVNRPGPKPKRYENKSQKTHTLALLLMGRTSELLDQPSIRRVLAGFTSAAQSSQANTTVLEMPDLTVIPQPIQEQAVAGLLIIGMQPRPEWADIFHPIPFVVEGGVVLPETRFDHVLVNNDETGRLAARHLLDAGARNLAYLNHDPAHSSFLPRLKGFEEEAAAAGARVRIYETSDSDSPEASYWIPSRLRDDFTELLDRMLADGGMPEGIYVPSDQQVAVLHALLRERGMGDGVVTISCNNDGPQLSSIHPRPATIDLRGEDLGRLALQRLLERIENPAADFAVTLMAPRLVRGG